MKESKHASPDSGWWRAAAVVFQLQLQALAGRRPRPHSAGQQPMPWAVCVLLLLAFPAAATGFAGAPCTAPGDGGPRLGLGAVMLLVRSPGT